MSFLRAFASAAAFPLNIGTARARIPQVAFRRTLALGSACVVATTTLALAKPLIYLDAATVSVEESEFVIDPDTSIAFPKVLKVPSKTRVPPLELVGLGVRTVSFLGLKVYSVAFYADLNNQNLVIPKDLPTELKLAYIADTTSCLIRIVPTRSTSYTHLRDAFMRALNGRLAQEQQEKRITDEDAFAIGSPLRKLKTLFPNSPLKKHEPLDVFLPAPIPGRPRPLIFRDLGSVESNWVAREFVLQYFIGQVPSPLLKKTVFERLENLESH